MKHRTRTKLPLGRTAIGYQPGFPKTVTFASAFPEEVGDDKVGDVIRPFEG